MSATAKLFMHDGSQAVCLPEEFRFEGTEVRVSRVGDKVILEPLARTEAEIAAVWAKIDALCGRDFLPDGIPDDPPTEPILASSSTSDLPRPDTPRRPAI